MLRATVLLVFLVLLLLPRVMLDDVRHRLGCVFGLLVRNEVGANRPQKRSSKRAQRAASELVTHERAACTSHQS